jgi:hypothetical protein
MQLSVSYSTCLAFVIRFPPSLELISLRLSNPQQSCLSWRPGASQQATTLRTAVQAQIQGAEPLSDGIQAQ